MIQVINSIPWVRCASGNVYNKCELNLSMIIVNFCQVHKYLLLTGQKLEMDMFNFDWWVQVTKTLACFLNIHFCLFSQVLQTFEVTGQVLKDISYGKEDLPVPCVNSVDHSLPEYIEYSTRRLPQEGVNVPFNVTHFCIL